MTTQDKHLTELIKRKLEQYTEQSDNVYFVVVDGFEIHYLDNIKKKYPSHVLTVGISEANAMSVAAGLALTGKTVFVIMLGMYSFCRAFDQLKLDVGYNNANVKIIGHGSGLWGAIGGYSHIGAEDIALLNTIPNLKIFTPTSKEEVEYFMDYCANNSGPMFLRFDFSYVRFSSYAETFANPNKHPKLSKLYTLCDGTDLTIITYQRGLTYAVSLRDKLSKVNISAKIITVTTLKPFDFSGLKKLIDEQLPIVTIEEHVAGGIAAIVGQFIAEQGKKIPFFPIYITKENFNMTGKCADFFAKLSNRDVQTARIIDYILNGNKEIKIFSKRIKYKNKNKYSITKRFIGIPLLKTNVKIGKKVKKTYLLFGFLPVFKIKSKKDK
mgnify:CR=1 FL=1